MAVDFGPPPQQQPQQQPYGQPQQQAPGGFPPGGAPQAPIAYPPQPQHQYAVPLPPPPQQQQQQQQQFGAPPGGAPQTPHTYQQPPAPGGYAQLPPQQYGAPQYGAPQAQYGQPMPHYGQPQWAPPPAGPQPVGPPGWGAPSPAPTWPQGPSPAPTWPQTPAGGYTPQPPAGYGAYHPPPQVNVANEVHSLHKAFKGFGTDEKTLTSILAKRDGQTIDAIRHGYNNKYGNLIDKLQSETSGNYRTAVVAAALGPIESECFWINKAVNRVGTNEAMLTEAVLLKSTEQIRQMQSVYQHLYGTSMDKAIKDDLSFQTKDFFVMALEADKQPEYIPIDPLYAQSSAEAIYNATLNRVGTKERDVCRILARANVSQIRAINYEFARFHGPLVDCIKSEFSGHMRDALIFIVEGALDPVSRDAKLLEQSMKGLGTKDDLLIMRLVRCHWNRIHMESVKNVYQKCYGKSLLKRVHGETSGNYRQFLEALIE